MIAPALERGGLHLTSKEAYLIDLEDLQKEIDALLRLVPIGKSKRDHEARERAEEAAGRARATIGCMRNDYVILENYEL